MRDLVDTAKAYTRAKGEHSFRVFGQQFTFEKIRLRVMLKSRCKVNAATTLSSLLMAWHDQLFRNG